MMRLVAMLCGLMLTTPVAARDQRAEVQHSPVARLMSSGHFSAEVWRRNIATGQDELAWSNAEPHATAAKAMAEACAMLKLYDAAMACPREAASADRQGVTATKVSARDRQDAPAAKKAVGSDRQAAVMAKKPTAPIVKQKPWSVRPLGPAPLSGYEVPGCAYYSLEEGKVVERCTVTGSANGKNFWRNYELSRGGSGGEGGGDGGSE